MKTVAQSAIAIIFLLAVAGSLWAGPISGRVFDMYPGGGIPPLFSCVGLSGEQKEQMKKIFLIQRPEMNNLIQQIGKERHVLMQRIHEDSPDEEKIRAQAAKLSLAESTAAVHHAKTIRMLKATLTPEQRRMVANVEKEMLAAGEFPPMMRPPMPPPGAHLQ